MKKPKPIPKETKEGPKMSYLDPDLGYPKPMPKKKGRK